MYPNSTLGHTLSSSAPDASHPPLDASPAIPVPPDPPLVPARSTKGVHTPFYGFYTSIREQLKQFGDPGIEALWQELEKMISKEVWTSFIQSSLSPAERKKTMDCRQSKSPPSRWWPSTR
jgi:hypothetical protein